MNKMTKKLEEVFQLVLQGYSNSSIAKMLNFSDASIKQSVRRILKIYEIPYSKEMNSRVLLIKKYYSKHKEEL